MVKFGVLIVLSFLWLAEAIHSTHNIRFDPIHTQKEQPTEGDVLTPFGYMPKECVHALGPNGRIETVDGKLHLLSANGTRTVHEACMNKRRSLQQSPPYGWAAYAEYYIGSGVKSFAGQWNVPDIPKSDVTQTLFLFTGLQNTVLESQSATIVQPVLQYGPSQAGGGSYWAIASWYVGMGNAVFGNLVQVQPGDTIYGVMATQSNGDWQVVTRSVKTGVSSSIVTSTPITEPYAFVTLVSIPFSLTVRVPVYIIITIITMMLRSTAILSLDSRDI
eukprot:TRINITY_DN1867_c0_g1_i2.p1 TRINITY_DN1867_c0_g1~~TRINITY_DN1867_c0_g1_i2.p1  ORF type:complete len:275 (+),score=31.09 TRINITY_DN1867_c0_g1_i2:32-856(+)